MTEQQTGNAANHSQPSASQRAPSKSHNKRTMLIRYGKMGFLALIRHTERDIPRTAKYVVAYTDRGMEIVEIIAPYFHHHGTFCLGDAQVDRFCCNSGENYPLTRQGRFVRFATSQDLNEQRHLELQAKREARFGEELIAKHNLPMKLVDVEHLFGGDRIIYYFIADGRVDFRQLVKELAHEYQTRIEMRQIGARDEARIVADYETCGRECCCKSFLKVLQPVNMRMAKLQKATLDPTKISGRCGRLKCCLRYEDQVYTELKKKLPRINSSVLVKAGPAVVVDTQVITQLVKVRLNNGAIIAVGVAEIIERDYQPPEPPDDAPRNAPRSKPEPRRSLRDSQKIIEQTKKSEDASDESQLRKRRRRRRKKKNTIGPGNADNDNPNTADDQQPT